MYIQLFLLILSPLLIQSVKMIVDTDGVADDVQALTIALQHPDVDLLAITTVTGSTTSSQAVANIARTFRANRVKKRIPVFKGAAEPLIGNINTTVDVVNFFGRDGISDKPFVEPPVRIMSITVDKNQFKASSADKDSYIPDLHAAEALISIFKEHKNEAVLVAIGPLTNLALALELDPDFAHWPKHLFITGGNIYGMGNIRTASTAEYNFNADPEAANIVLERMKCPITLVAWESTFFYMDIFNVKFDFDSHLNLNYPLAHYLKAVTSMPRKVMSQFDRYYRYCDEITIATAIDSSVVTRPKNISVAVELHGTMTRGQLVVGWLEEWIGKGSAPMTSVKLVLDYDVNKVDKFMVDAIKNVGNEDEEKNSDDK